MLIEKSMQKWTGAVEFCISPKQSPSHVLANISSCPHLENVYQQQAVFSQQQAVFSPPTIFSSCWCSGNTSLHLNIAMLTVLCAPHDLCFQSQDSCGAPAFHTGDVFSAHIDSPSPRFPHWSEDHTQSTRSPAPKANIQAVCISLYFPSYCPSLSLKKRTPNQCHLLMTPMHRVDVAWALAEARTHQKAAAQHSSSISWADLSARCFILTPERLLDLVSQLNTNHLGVFQMSARRSYEIKPVFIRYSRSTRENLQIKKLSGLWCRPFWSWGAAVAA